MTKREPETSNRPAVEVSRITRDLIEQGRSLGPDERVSWVGTPESRRLFHRSDLFAVPWLLASLIFLVAWEYELLKVSGWRDPHADPLAQVAPYVALPCLLFLVYALGPRLFVRRAARRKTRYVLTNQRILITEEFFGCRLRACDLKDVKQVKLKAGRHGYGDLRFYLRRGEFTLRPFLFEDVAAVDEVCREVRERVANVT